MTPKKKTKVLFLAQLPPPVHGSAVMNRYLHESQKLRQTFDIDWIDISLGNSLESVGKFNFAKIIIYLNIHIKLLWRLLFKRPKAVYLTIAPFGAPFYKDSLLVIWLKIFGVRRIFHMHGKGVNEELSGGGIKNKYYNYIFKGVYLIHLSQSLLKDLDGIKKIKGKYILPNGIPSHSFKKTEKKEIQILYLSNFFESKGAMELLKAASLIIEKNKYFRLCLAGGWPDLNFKQRLFDFQQSINWNGRLEIIGPVYNEEKERLLQKSDILVFPTRYRMECFPLVILEAMSYGLVVFASAAGAIPEILNNGEAGILIDPNDTEAFASQIEELLNNDEERKKLSERALQVFKEKFTKERFEENFIEILKDILR